MNVNNSTAKFEKKGCPVILQELFKFCSIVFQDTTTKDLSAPIYTNLCLIILLCLVENSELCKNFIFDIKLEINIYLLKKV